ncbi:MAG: NADH-quinone oxidoreductase subunit A [Acidobacteriota bacterium]
MNSTLLSYYPFFIFLVFAVGLAASLVILSTLFGRRRRREPEVDLSAYECGVPEADTRHRRLTIHFYLVGMLFILFDLEVAFLYPWAVSYRALGWAGFAVAGLFLGLLTVGFIYIWSQGALDWAPPRRAVSGPSPPGDDSGA